MVHHLKGQCSGLISLVHLGPLGGLSSEAQQLPELPRLSAGLHLPLLTAVGQAEEIL